MSEKGFIPPYTGYLKKTPKSIMLKRMEEENWKLKCVEVGLGEKRLEGLEEIKLSDKRYKCPRCKSPLVFHHEDRETVTFECKKCKHFVLARKC